MKRNRQSTESSSVSSLTPSSSEEAVNMMHHKRSRVDEHYPNHSYQDPNAFTLEQVRVTTNANTALHVRRTLSLLDKDQLVLVIQSLMQTPALTEHILQALPAPTLASVSSILSTLNCKLTASLPYSKQATGQHHQPVSDYGYNRVAGLLVEIQETVLYYLDHFCHQPSPTARSHEYADVAIGYLHLAIGAVCKIPEFITASYNEQVKYALIGRIVVGWVHVLGVIKRGENDKAQGLTGHSSGGGVGSIRVWAGFLHEDCARVDGHFGFKELWDGYIAHFGWLIGGGDRHKQ